MPEGAVKVGDIAGPAKPVDTERHDRVAGNRAEPRQGRRVKVPDGDEACTRAQADGGRAYPVASLRAYADVR
jgi:hypothetical protein